MIVLAISAAAALAMIGLFLVIDERRVRRERRCLEKLMRERADLDHMTFLQLDAELKKLGPVHHQVGIWGEETVESVWTENAGNRFELAMVVPDDATLQGIMRRNLLDAARRYFSSDEEKIELATLAGSMKAGPQ